MNIQSTRRRRLAVIGAFAFAAVVSAEAQTSTRGNACMNEQGVAGWAVTVSLAPEEKGDLLISKWEVRKNFSTHFGIRVIYDTSSAAEPYLQIWHNYKRGDFTMRLPDGRWMSSRLSANYAVTKANLPPNVMEYLRAAPVVIEHTAHDGGWRKYETDGLPEALAAADTDLAALKEKHGNKECGARQEWWRRFTGER